MWGGPRAPGTGPRAGDVAAAQGDVCSRWEWKASRLQRALRDLKPRQQNTLLKGGGKRVHSHSGGPGLRAGRGGEAERGLELASVPAVPLRILQKGRECAGRDGDVLSPSGGSGVWSLLAPSSPAPLCPTSQGSPCHWAGSHPSTCVETEAARRGGGRQAGSEPTPRALPSTVGGGGRGHSKAGVGPVDGLGGPRGAAGAR